MRHLRVIWTFSPFIARQLRDAPHRNGSFCTIRRFHALLQHFYINFKFKKQKCFFFFVCFKLVNALKSIYLYLKRWKVLTFYLDGSRVFIPLEPCCFQRSEGLESSLFSTILTGDKYFLHVINEIASIYSRSLKKPYIYLQV